MDKSKPAAKTELCIDRGPDGRFRLVLRCPIENMVCKCGRTEGLMTMDGTVWRCVVCS